VGKSAPATCLVLRILRNYSIGVLFFVNPKTKNCEYGAFFVEPVQATGGYIVPPKGYFKELKKLLDRYQILFVDDEVHMGFYRTGKMWAIENFDVVPDIIVFGKACTNGLNPLSGIWAKEHLISPEVFSSGSTHSTYSSNSIGTAAGFGSHEPYRGRQIFPPASLKRASIFWIGLMN